MRCWDCIEGRANIFWSAVGIWGWRDASLFLLELICETNVSALLTLGGRMMGEVEGRVQRRSMADSRDLLGTTGSFVDDFASEELDAALDWA